MDLVSVLQDYGFPMFAAVAMAYLSISFTILSQKKSRLN